jgi:hypothetical protein
VAYLKRMAEAITLAKEKREEKRKGERDKNYRNEE